ncbi:hypothetical protein [Metabacillus idriensis]|uniref:hypothetical protein n=1 Tax=Metabacillus idriensis TaxID=324768 RepID=UPI001749A4BA|nr:hypothetical protein [Metabacillus idriensis]
MKKNSLISKNRCLTLSSLTLSRSGVRHLSSGGQASPIYFDAKSYYNSAAYKMKDSVQHQAKSYLSFKKEQAEKRKIEKLQKELETPNLSLDEYLKIAEDLGEENLSAEQKYIMDQIKALGSIIDGKYQSDD